MLLFCHSKFPIDRAFEEEKKRSTNGVLKFAYAIQWFSFVLLLCYWFLFITITFLWLLLGAISNL